MAGTIYCFVAGLGSLADARDRGQFPRWAIATVLWLASVVLVAADRGIFSSVANPELLQFALGLKYCAAGIAAGLMWCQRFVDRATPSGRSPAEKAKLPEADDAAAEPADDRLVACRCPACRSELSFPPEVNCTVEPCPHCGASMVVREESEGGARPFPLPLKTDRLLLRRLSPDDAPELTALLSEPDAFRSPACAPRDPGSVREWIQYRLQIPVHAPDTFMCFGLVSQDEAKLVGIAELYSLPDEPNQGGFNLLVATRERRKGHGTEALSALLQLGFETVGFRRITATCDTSNVAATRLLEKQAMRREGVCLEDFEVNSEWRDTHEYALLTSEFTTRSVSTKTQAHADTT